MWLVAGGSWFVRRLVPHGERGETEGAGDQARHIVEIVSRFVGLGHPLPQADHLMGAWA